MKIFVTIFAIAALISCAFGAAMPEGRYEPLDDIMPYESEPLVDGTNRFDDSAALQPHIRERRFTCDVFSFQSKWLTPNHSACALKCVAMGRRGGKCVNMECQCRRPWF